MPAWAVWTIAGTALAAGSLLTPALFFVRPLAVAAFSTAVIAAAVGGGTSAVASVGAVVICVVVLRPIAMAAAERSRIT